MTELDLVTKTAELLKPKGEVRMEYISASFSPMADKFRPDLVFFPTDRANKAFFVEYRNASAAFFRSSLKAQVAQLIEHRDFIDFDRPITLHYAFATDASSDESLRAALQQQGIAYLCSVGSPEHLANKITSWQISFT